MGMDICFNEGVVNMELTNLRPSASCVIRTFKWQIVDVMDVIFS